MIDTRTEGDGDEPQQLLRYQYSNHLGSASLELDSAGAIISYEEYHPYGTTSFQSGRSVAEVSLKRYRYTGKERDEETGLAYHGARYYAPWLCRWTAVDPLESDYLLWSTYCYCKDNPVINIDKDGMRTTEVTVWVPIEIHLNEGESFGQGKIRAQLMAMDAIVDRLYKDLMMNDSQKGIGTDQQGYRVMDLGAPTFLYNSEKESLVKQTIRNSIVLDVRSYEVVPNVKNSFTMNVVAEFNPSAVLTDVEMQEIKEEIYSMSDKVDIVNQVNEELGLISNKADFNKLSKSAAALGYGSKLMQGDWSGIAQGFLKDLGGKAYENGFSYLGKNIPSFGPYARFTGKALSLTAQAVLMNTGPEYDGSEQMQKLQGEIQMSTIGALVLFFEFNNGLPDIANNQHEVPTIDNLKNNLLQCK